MIKYGTTDTSCTITGLDPDTSYLFDVIAYTSEKLPYNNGKDRAISEITVKTLGDIANLKGSTSSTNSAKLTWDKYSDADYYKVFLYENNKWNLLEKVTTNSFTATKLVANTSYKFRVSAYNSANKLLAYSDTTAKTLANIANLKGSTSSTNTAKLTWDKNTSASYYKVFSYESNKWMQLTNTTSTTYTATNLTPNTSYKFRVLAYDENNKLIAYSDITAKTAFDKITNLKATSTSNTAKLTWSKYSGADFYKVYVAKDGKWVQLYKTSNNSTVAYTATGLTPNTSYKFRVVGYKGTTAVAYADITAKTAFASITNLKATSTSNTAKLTWSKYSGADFYKVYVAKDGKWVQLYQTSNNSTVVYTVTKLTANTSYKFRVVGCKGTKAVAYADVTVKTK